jgi:hypothetical protein
MPARPVARLVAAAGIAGWFGFNAVMAFYTYLWRNSPGLPDFAGGRIAPMYHRHIHVFFVEPWEKRVAFYGLVLSLGLLLAAGAVGVVLFRRELALRRGLSWLNLSALAAFLCWFGYALWPLAPH